MVTWNAIFTKKIYPDFWATLMKLFSNVAGVSNCAKFHTFVQPVTVRPVIRPSTTWMTQHSDSDNDFHTDLDLKWLVVLNEHDYGDYDGIIMIMVGCIVLWYYTANLYCIFYSIIITKPNHWMFALIRLNASCGKSLACPSPIMAGIYTQIFLMFCDDSPAPVIFSCAPSKRLKEKKMLV